MLESADGSRVVIQPCLSLLHLSQAETESLLYFKLEPAEWRLCSLSLTRQPQTEKRHPPFLQCRLENGPRGVYSGSLGFIGLNNTFDLNIVIRTAVVEPGQVTIGAGGAIVMQSDRQDEYEEMRLKARALMNAVDKCAGKLSVGS